MQLTKEEANQILDQARAGIEVSRQLINMALIVTGDLCVSRLVVCGKIFPDE